MAMNKRTAWLVSPLLLVVAACGSDPAGAPNSQNANADDFAARINGKAGPAPAPAATNAPTIAAPLAGAADGPFVPGTMTDPGSSICGANAMGEFLGKPADQATRAAQLKRSIGLTGLVFMASASPLALEYTFW